MEKNRGHSVFLVMMVLLLVIGLVVLFWGAATYVKPRMPFLGPQVNLRMIISGE